MARPAYISVKIAMFTIQFAGNDEREGDERAEDDRGDGRVPRGGTGFTALLAP